MFSPSRRWFALIMLAVGVACRSSNAAEAVATKSPVVLAHVPADALGVVVIADLADTDAKAQRLLQMFNAPAPPPLALLQLATGLGPGIDKSGDMALAFLPGAEGKPALVPLLAVPVNEYAEFVAPLNGDPTGEICRVVVAGEELLVGKAENFALLMNVEHRQRLEQVLGAEPTLAPELETLGSWFAANQVTAMLLPAGAELVWKLGREGLASQSAEFEEQFADEAFADTVAEMKRSFAMLDLLLGNCSDEIHAVAVGLSIDDDANLRLGKRALLKPKSRLGKLGEGAAPVPQLLRGYADEPFVAVGGGPVSGRFAEFLVDLNDRLVALDPDGFGFGGIPEEELKAAFDKQRTMYDGVNSLSIAYLPGKENDALMSNYYMVLGCDDSAKVLDRWEQGMQIANDLMERSTSELKMHWAMERRTIAGKPALELSADLGELMADELVGFMDAYAEDLFGKDGKLRWPLVAADAGTVVSGIASDESLVELGIAATHAEAPLANSAPVAATTALFDPEAPWRLYVSPQGTVQWFGRIFKMLTRHFGGGAPEIPDYPATPPVGFTLKIASDRLEADMVWPAATLEGLSQYIATVQKEMAE
ncbi:MAG: hypothetical protein KF847_11900 [Pirellulales bacterium]|nr:hypothetical protein [Pirellulales bacterium]